MRIDSKELDQERQNETPNLLILFTKDSNFNVLAHAARGGSNGLVELTETWTQQWCIFNEIKIPGPLWQDEWEGIQRFMETGKLD